MTTLGPHLIVAAGRPPFFGTVETAFGRTRTTTALDRSPPFGAFLLAPGFVDLQINGAFGDDFTDAPESIWAVGSRLCRFGVTAFLPTIITASEAKVDRAIAVFLAGPPSGYRGARALGLHLEGPFLNAAARGAHEARFLRTPDRPTAERWARSGAVRLVTLAPELPGALEVVDILKGPTLAVSAGHSRATAAEAVGAFDRGVSLVTHIFNAMPPLHHRAPGLAGAALADDRIAVGLIADRVHVDPMLIKTIWRAKGGDRVVLVTDAMAALGSAPGVYTLAGQEVRVDLESARLADGTLAGSILTLDQAVRNVRAITGLELADILPSASTVPAALIGAPNDPFESGAQADFVLLDASGHVVETWVGGERTFSRRESPPGGGSPRPN